MYSENRGISRPNYNQGRGQPAFRGRGTDFRRGTSAGRGRGTSAGRGRGTSAGRGRGHQVSSTIKDFVSECDNGKVLRCTNPAHVKFESCSPIVDEFSQSFKVVGGYSEDDDKNFSLDKSSLLFLKTEYLPDEESREMAVNFDLKEGVSNVRNYTGTPVRAFHNILSWIVSNVDTFRKAIDSSKKSSRNGGHFIFQKNVLSSIVVMPYSFRGDFEVFAVTINSLTFILRGSTSGTVNNSASNFGHNFEKIMSRETFDPVVHSNKDFRVVLSANLDGHTLFYSAATDCVNPELYDEDLEDMTAFVGLKTLPELLDDTHQSIFARCKAIRFYFYCLLLGIDNIILGFKNDNGIVSKLQLYNKQELLKIGENIWHPELCLTYGSKLFSFIKKNCDESPGQVFRFRKESNSNEVICTEDDEYEQPVPDWFFEELRNQNLEE